MLLIDQYRALARYNRWMNAKLFALAAPLGDEERKRDRGAFFRSIDGTLNHVLLADRSWMLRFTGDRARYTSHDGRGEPIVVTSLGQELYAEFDRLRAERERTDADIEGWADGLTEAWLVAPLSYKTSTGEPQHHPAWWAVGHFFNHQTHHRGQLTTLLKQAGVDPGVTDLIAMLRTEGR